MISVFLQRVSVLLVLVLSYSLLLKSLKIDAGSSKSALCIMIALKLDVKLYPSRNTPGFSRNSSVTHCPIPYKVKAGLYIFKTTLAASCLVLLAGDVSPNPGPISDSHNAVGFPKARGLKLAHLNVRSLVNKIDDIQSLIYENPFDIFTISESWLNSSILDSEVSLHGYTLVRQDRKNKRGGGTAIFIRDGIPYTHRSDLSTGDIETCWAEINRSKCKKLFVCSVYRPPDFCPDKLINGLNDSLGKLPIDSEIIVMGDFNIDFLAKNTDRVPYKLKQKLQRFARSNNLEQLIHSPTRIHNQSSSAIDLILANNNHRIVDNGVIPSAISDHFIIYCVIKSGVPKAKPKTIEYRSYRSYTKEYFVSELNEIDWSIIDNCNDIDSAVEAWNNVFSEVANRHAPIKKTRVKGLHAPWMTPILSDAMRDRDFHHRKAVKTNSKFHWDQFKKIKNFTNNLVKKCKSDYYINLINQNKRNANALWSTLNEITSRKSRSPVTCIEVDGVQYHQAYSIAETLNSHFCSIGSKLIGKLKSGVAIATLQLRVPDSTNLNIDGFAFHPVEDHFVRNQLSKLKTNKATGLDRINARLLKDSAVQVTPVLTNLFNRSLLSSTFPSAWKSGKVVPLFKSGQRCNPGNYRPITVLPTVSKILEKAVHIQVYNYLLEHKILTPRQFGFRPQLSTEIAITHFTDSVLDSMDKGRVTGAVFLDLSKAFDTIDHMSLLQKLTNVGFTSSAVDWFKSYLSQRTQVTFVGDASSSAKHVPVGVPQGSVLGPLLFIIYINELPSVVNSCEVSFYADDTVIYYSTSDFQDLEDKLNCDLANICQWFNDNFLTLNVSKCKFVLFGNQNKLRSCSHLSLKINDHVLERHESFKYLGVKINQNMSWSDHIETMSNKISQRLCLLRRIRHLLPLHARLTVYNSLILPLFEYADLVWGDKNNVVLMNHLQVLHNNSARIILDMPKHSSASKALEQLSWKPLSDRRCHHRCIAVFKCLNKLINFDFNFSKNTDVHSYNTRRRQDIHLPRARTNWGKQRFVFHAAKDWNNLEPDVQQSTSLSAFKGMLK